MADFTYDHVQEALRTIIELLTDPKSPGHEAFCAAGGSLENLKTTVDEIIRQITMDRLKGASEQVILAKMGRTITRLFCRAESAHKQALANGEDPTAAFFGLSAHLVLLLHTAGATMMTLCLFDEATAKRSQPSDTQRN